MPSKKKKYNARFPATRIKKIMQSDEEVGKVAQAVPIMISRTLELFVHSLLTKTMQITSYKQAKTLSPAHMKQCILSETRFDFLKDLVKNLPDASGGTDDDPNARGDHFVVPAPLTSSVAIAPIAPRTSTVVASNVPKDDSSCAQVPPRRHSVDKGDKAKLAKPVKDNETVFASAVPKSKTSVPTFNASQPNFYTELNSSPSDNVPRISTFSSQPVLNFTRTAVIDEDYDT